MVVIRHHNRASAQRASVRVTLPRSRISDCWNSRSCAADLSVLDDLAFALLGRRTVAKAAKHDPRRQGAGVLGGQLAQWRDEVDAGVLCQLGHHIGVPARRMLARSALGLQPSFWADWQDRPLTGLAPVAVCGPLNVVRGVLFSFESFVLIDEDSNGGRFRRLFLDHGTLLRGRILNDPIVR